MVQCKLPIKHCALGPRHPTEERVVGLFAEDPYEGITQLIDGLEGDCVRYDNEVSRRGRDAVDLGAIVGSLGGRGANAIEIDGRLRGRLANTRRV